MMRSLRSLLIAVIVLLVAFLVTTSPNVSAASDRELFLDHHFISEMTDCEILVHQPLREEIALTLDQPWEGNACNYWTVLYDEQQQIYRAYCHGWSLYSQPGQLVGHPLVMTTYESVDGIHWTRPNLGICEWEGSKENNIILKNAPNGLEPHDFSPFIDTNPNCEPDARFKTLGASIDSPKGLFAFKSPDGIHWTPYSDEPIYTDGYFDSQNVSFWSETEQQYVLYYRVIDWRPDGEIRQIHRAVSDDFIHWKNEGILEYPEGEGPTHEIQFYINQIRPYYRSPKLYLGFPIRYVDHGLIPATDLLPEPEERHMRINVGQRLGTAVTDSIYITSYDGHFFTQSNDGFLSPGLRTRNNWSYGDNYMAWNMLETESTRGDMPREISLYATESAATGKVSYLRRYSLRIDGFGSVHAKSVPGTMTTKPFVCDGDELSINLGTTAAGSVRVELLDADGQPIPGYTAEEADLFFGNTLDWRVTWNGSADLSSIKGKTISARFYLREADIYSMKVEDVLQ